MEHSNRVAAFVDGSQYSDIALKEALDWRNPKDKLFVVHIAETIGPWAMGFADASEKLNMECFDETNRKLIEKGRETCMHYKNMCHEHDAENFEVMVLSSTKIKPKESAIQFIKKYGIKTSIVGPRGLGAFKKFFLGSFSDYVLKHSPSAVFIARQKSPGKPKAAAKAATQPPAPSAASAPAPATVSPPPSSSGAATVSTEESPAQGTGEEESAPSGEAEDGETSPAPKEQI